MNTKRTRTATRLGPIGDSGESGDVGTFRADRRWLRWLAIIAGAVALVAAGCSGSDRTKSTSVGAPTMAGGTEAASTGGSVKLPPKGCGLLSDVVVTALLGGPSASSRETGLPGGSPPVSVVGCTWMGAAGHQAGVILHQGSRSARDFADNTTGPALQSVSGLGDQAILNVAAGGEEGSIEVLKGDIDILVFGTLSGSADGYAASLKQAAATILTRLGPG